MTVKNAVVDKIHVSTLKIVKVSLKHGLVYGPLTPPHAWQNHMVHLC